MTYGEAKRSPLRNSEMSVLLEISDRNKHNGRYEHSFGYKNATVFGPNRWFMSTRLARLVYPAP